MIEQDIEVLTKKARINICERCALGFVEDKKYSDCHYLGYGYPTEYFQKPGQIVEVKVECDKNRISYTNIIICRNCGRYFHDRIIPTRSDLLEAKLKKEIEEHEKQLKEKNSLLSQLNNLFKKHGI